MLRYPAKFLAELDAFVLAQINEGERSLLLQSQLWLQRQHFFRWCKPPRSATFHDAGELLASAELEQAILGELLVSETIMDRCSYCGQLIARREACQVVTRDFRDHDRLLWPSVGGRGDVAAARRLTRRWAEFILGLIRISQR